MKQSASGLPVNSKRTSFNSLERGILLPPNVTNTRGRPSHITHRTPLQSDFQLSSSNQFDALSLETLITEVSSTQTPLVDKQRGSDFVASQPKMSSQFRSHQGQSFNDAATVMFRIRLTNFGIMSNCLFLSFVFFCLFLSFGNCVTKCPSSHPSSPFLQFFGTWNSLASKCHKYSRTSCLLILHTGLLCSLISSFHPPINLMLFLLRQ